MRFTRIPAASIAVIALAFLSAAPEIRAADTEARARLDALVATYRALPAYVDHGAVEVEVKVAGKSNKERSETPVVVARPNRLRVKTPLVEIVSDGKSLVTSVPAVKKFSKSAVPAKLSHNDLTEGPLGSYERGNPLGMPLRVLLTLLLDDDPASALLRDATGVSIEKDVALDGVTYQVLRLDSDVAPSIKILIDPRTKLASSIEVLLAERTTSESSVPGSDVSFGAFRWTAGEVSTAAPAPESFQTKPADGFKEIVGLDATETAKSEHELVGKPVPDFTLNVLDTGGKTRRLPVKELRGKVVLIDFWATWCVPCRKEMPDIAKLSEALAKAKKPAVVVALSTDQPKDADLAGLEKKVRADIKGLGFDIEAAPSRLLAIDPSGTTAQAFGVQAIPTIVILDEKGVIRAVHVGITERDVLEAEIDALIAGKPIPKAP